MCTYYYYDMAPPEGVNCLSLDEVLTRVADAFPRHEFSPEEAREDAARRLAALEKLGAPEPILESYREGNPVRCRIADPDAEEYLEFDVWEGQGMLVHPHPKDVRDSCAELAKRLANVLGYNLTLEEYD